MKLAAFTLVFTATTVSLGACGDCREAGERAPDPADRTRPFGDAAPPRPAERRGLDINAKAMVLEDIPADVTPLGIAFGPLGHHVAWVEERPGARKRLVVDGRPGADYVTVEQYIWSRDGLQLVYPGNLGPGVGPDGRHMVRRWYLVVGTQRHGPYAGVDSYRVSDLGEVSWRATLRAPKTDGSRATEANLTVIVDGVADPPFVEIPPSDMAFDASGELAAYRARSGQGWHIVQRGAVGPPYGRVGRPVTSPNGRHVGYAASSGRDNESVIQLGDTAHRLPFTELRQLTIDDVGGAAVVGDGVTLVPNVASPGPDTWITASRFWGVTHTRRGLAYVASKGNAREVVLGTSRAPLPDDANIREFVVGPRSRRYLVVYGVAGGVAASVDGSTWPGAAVIENIQWSPSGRHLAYVMRTSGEPVDRKLVTQDTVVADGTAYGPFRKVTGLSWSGGKERLAFVARGKAGDWQLWVDGARRTDLRGAPLPDGVAWSPDGSRYAFGVREGSKQWLSTDTGTLSGPTDRLFLRRFSQDGSVCGAGAAVGKELRWMTVGFDP